MKGRRLALSEDDEHFQATKNIVQLLRKVGDKHLRHIQKGLGINSKYYKDRGMLTPEEGGDPSEYKGYDDEFEDEQSEGGQSEDGQSEGGDE